MRATPRPRPRGGDVAVDGGPCDRRGERCRRRRAEREAVRSGGSPVGTIVVRAHRLSFPQTTASVGERGPVPGSPRGGTRGLGEAAYGIETQHVVAASTTRRRPRE